MTSVHVVDGFFGSSIASLRRATRQRGIRIEVRRHARPRARIAGSGACELRKSGCTSNESRP
ncbi:hypothetical protein [Lysobacter gummosus]|uniref:hypothetical protein n=1 Tax=Lysobacter gummosus TaxID=262324 RepID=UPI003631A5F4